MGGKDILIKSVVQGIPNFAMACFLLPKKLCEKLDSLTRNFWWKGNPKDKGICWTSWENMGKAKDHGGMGFRNYRAFNEAMLARNGWRMLMNPNAYWARFFKGIYFPNSSFLQASRGNRASWAWLSLLHGRNLLLKGLRWQVQDGKSIDFWADAWIPSLPNFKVPIPRPANSAINKVVDIIDDNSGQWDIQKMLVEIPVEVVNAILEIPLARVGRADQLAWHFNPNGCYSVKSGYHIALQNLSEKVSNKPGTSFNLAKEVWKVLWKMKVPNKVKNFW
ncbi:hypothetical protein RHGRI_034338 [Rhododendron griersonianum]|uniref:Uncharacterized protein n=3 Tax=Rhododendron griersonianum TaxID=479676 RepID=A0AAV6I083_9ERIC|nr:hypothetical protein RHGRI_034338 [Rhododendron griersonianum]